MSDKNYDNNDLLLEGNKSQNNSQNFSENSPLTEGFDDGGEEGCG